MKKKIISLFICMFTMVNLFTTVQVYADNNITINVEMGLDGNIQLNRFTPVIVEVKNNGKDINGNLKVIVPYSDKESIEYTVPANIPRGTQKKFEVIVNVVTQLKSIDVLLEENNQIIKKLTHQVKELDINKYYVGILTEDKSGLSYWEGSLGDNSIFKNNETIYLSKENFPRTYEVMDNFSIIVINNYDTTSLSKKQLLSLQHWIENGGILILGTGVSGNKTLKGLTGKFDYIQHGDIYNLQEINELEILTKKPILNKSGFQLMNLDVKDSKNIVTNNDNDIIYQLSKGQGNIFITAFDLGIEPIVSWTGSKTLWDKLIPNFLSKNKLSWFIDPSNREGNFNDRHLHLRLADITENINALNIPSFGLILIILIVYMIVVGPINYLILKKKDKKEWAWFTIPLFAIIFSIGLYVSGYFAKGGGKIIANKASIINLNSNTNYAEAISYYGIYVPKKGNYEFMLPSESLISIYNTSGRNYEPVDKVNELRNIASINRGELSTISFNNENMWTMKNFYINEQIHDFGNIDADFYYDGTNIKGTVSNNTKYPINDLIIYRDGNYEKLGDIAAGETKQVDLFIQNLIIDGESSNNRYYKMVDTLYPIERNNSIFNINSYADKNRENRVKADLIRAIFRNNALDENFDREVQDINSVKIFGFCNSIIGQQLKVNNNNIDESYNTSIVFCNENISLEKSKDIALALKAENVKISNDDMVKYEDDRILMTGSYCDFDVNLSKYNNYKLKNMQIVINNNRAFKLSLYDYNQEQYVKIEKNEADVEELYGMKDDKYYKLKQNILTVPDNDISRYIDSNGMLKLRISSAESTYINEPKIYFGGRRKND